MVAAVAAHPALAHLEREFDVFWSKLPNAEPLHSAGLLLAWAAARGEPNAVKALDALLVQQTRKVVAGMPEVAFHAEDLTQRVRQRLFASGAKGESGLVQYQG